MQCKAVKDILKVVVKIAFRVEDKGLSAKDHCSNFINLTSKKEFQYIFMPGHVAGNHWVGYVVSFKDRMIIVFDPLGPVNRDKEKRLDINLQLIVIKHFWSKYWNHFFPRSSKKRIMVKDWQVVFLCDDQLQNDSHNCGVWVSYFAYCLFVPTRQMAFEMGTTALEVCEEIKRRMFLIQDQQKKLTKFRYYMLYCMMENKLFISNKVRLPEDAKCHICWAQLTPCMYVQCHSCGIALCRHCYNNKNARRNFLDQWDQMTRCDGCPNCNKWTDWLDDGSNYLEYRPPLLGYYRDFTRDSLSEGIYDYEDWYECVEQSQRYEFLMERLLPPIVDKDMNVYERATLAAQITLDFEPEGIRFVTKPDNLITVEGEAP